MNKTVLIATILFLAATGVAIGSPYEGDHLYKVSTIRAASGEFEALLDDIAALKSSDYFKIAAETPPMVIRHSQGDHWDLMIISSMGSWAEYYASDAERKRSEAASANEKLLNRLSARIAFDEDHFAYGPPLNELQIAFDENELVHIEMFHAVAGKSHDLLTQRRMENDYLRLTGQVQNTIFRRAAGSDVDVFTIGFHKSLEAFAAPAPANDEDKEVAAVTAGFKDRADISFYLRRLISGHHDTLAGTVK